MGRGDKYVRLLFFVIGMAACVICGYSGGQLPVSGTPGERVSTVEEEEPVEEAAEEEEAESGQSVLEDGEEDVPEKPKKKYAKWRYDKETHVLTIGGEKETHRQLSAKEINEGFDENFVPPSVKVAGGWKSSSEKLRENVERIVIEEGVISINSTAFAYFGNVREIVLPDTLRRIRSRAFYGCSHLETITIPDSVRFVGQECFRDCTALQQITFGRSVRRIADGNFHGCPALHRISINPENPYLAVQDGIFYHRKQKIVYLGYATGSEVSIPDGMKRIAPFAFEGRANLQELYIPASVTEIGGGAFCQCKNLRSVTFAEHSKCKRIDSYSMDNQYTDDPGWLYGCFGQCESLTEMIFPDSLRQIGYGILEGCHSLKKLHFGKEFRDIASEKGIYATGSLEEVSVSEENERYCSEDGILYDKKKESLFLYPESKKGRRFEVPESVRRIKEHAFSTCHFLRSLVIRRDRSIIESNGIYGCQKLRSVFLYGESARLEYAAINYCRNLQKVKIYGRYTKLKTNYPYIGKSIEGCREFTIYARKNTGAEKYAKNYKKVKFVALPSGK